MHTQVSAAQEIALVLLSFIHLVHSSRFYKFFEISCMPST
jgi:hypothetical protein